MVKTGLVLEGGAMRGMFTAGVLDVFMDNNIKFDGIIGVSAGALFGVNYLSKQRGRVVRYAKRFNGQKEYMSLSSLIKTGDLVNIDYAYNVVPRQLDVFDDETYMKDDTAFYAVVTNIETGEAEYMPIKSVFEQMDVLRASGSMPFVSKPVELDGKYYLDGAVADSIPVKKFLEMGYDRLIVVLTKHDGYVKGPIPPWLANTFYKKKYPEFAKKVRDRHIMYNDTISYIRDLKRKKEIFVICPSQYYKISKVEKDPDKLQGLYELGLSDCEKCVEEVKKFLGQ